MKYILYNPHSGNKTGKEEAEKLARNYEGAALTDMTAISSYRDYFSNIPKNEPVILCGGDGTLNRYLNDTEGLSIPNPIYYYGTGSGNDFLHDLGFEKGHEPIEITEYLKNLPIVTVNGTEYRVLNGVGYGIDGYCCEVGDKLRETSAKPVSYAAIAIKGLLFHYQPTDATVTVDGEAHHFKKVWLAPVMFGRYYGGGMIPTPNQNRLSENRTVSCMVMYGAGRLKTLCEFPAIFKGEHIKYSKNVSILTGKNIKVEFSRPVACQIDGETILNVSKIEVKAE